jgi:hypothetical protein
MPQIQLTKNSSGASITRDAAQVKASIERAFYELGESYIADRMGETPSKVLHFMEHGIQSVSLLLAICQLKVVSKDESCYPKPYIDALHQIVSEGIKRESRQ